jgi:hypothetical protein
MITDYFEVLTQMITDCYDDLTIQYSIMKRKIKQIPHISTKWNNHLSSQFIKHKQITLKYDFRNPGFGLNGTKMWHS